MVQRRGKKQRVYVIEDHLMVVEMIKEIVNLTPELAWAGYANNLNSAIRDLQTELQIDLLVLDISLPDGNGWEIWNVKALHELNLATLVITGRSDQRLIEFIASNQILGALNKLTASLSDWKLALKSVATGNRYFSASFEREISHFKRNKHNWLTRLSERELELLNDFGRGHDDDRIAAKYKLTCSTVQTHRRNIMHKLDLHSRGQLIRWCAQNGFVRFLPD